MKRQTFWAALLAITTLTAGALAPAAHANTLSTSVIGMFPADAGEFAYADLRQARSMSWFSDLKEQMLPERFRQFEKFLTQAGIDPNSQVEELAWALVPNQPTGTAQSAGVPTSEQVVGVALGQFQPEVVENYLKTQKVPSVQVRSYTMYSFGGGSGPSDLFFVFLDANTVAFGQGRQLQRLADVRDGQAPGLLDHSELGPMITQANGSGVVWAVMSAAYTRLAMQQLAPEATAFPQAQQLASRLRALSLEIIAGTGVEARFQAVCATPDDANTFAALLQAGLMYRRYQVGNSNPDLASMLDQARVTPAGDQLNIELTLTDAQVEDMIRRNTFVLKM